MFSHSMSPTKSPTHGGGWVKLTNSESPDVATKLSVIIPQELLGSNLEFGYAVGSGGGHRLIIKEAVRIRIVGIVNLINYCDAELQSVWADYDESIILISMIILCSSSIVASRAFVYQLAYSSIDTSTVLHCFSMQQ